MTDEPRPHPSAEVDLSGESVQQLRDALALAELNKREALAKFLIEREWCILIGKELAKRSNLKYSRKGRAR